MAHKKQRVLQHLMEDESYQIIKKLIPKEWVVREFNRPDYGIDLVIELFEKIDDKTYETLGEFIYIQVKSAEKIGIVNEKIFGIQNVGKAKWTEDKSEYVNLEVVKYSFDTNSIYTIQRLGASVCILLFLVDIATEDVYFINMNDYIDKILLPKKPNYSVHKTSTITIPTLNNLKNTEISTRSLSFYGKRAKLLAAFAKFNYQRNELEHAMEIKEWPTIISRTELNHGIHQNEKEVYDLVLLFILQIENLDIWDHESWVVLPKAKEDLAILKDYLLSGDVNWNRAKDYIVTNWRILTRLGNIYEDICREWYLPKIISLLTSYPGPTEFIKSESKIKV